MEKFVKKSFAILAVVFMLIFATGCSLAKNSLVESGENVLEFDKSVESEFLKIKTMLDNIYDFDVEFPVKYNMRDKQMIIFDEKSDDVLVWNFDGKGSSKKISKSELNPSNTFSSFSEGIYNGMKAIFVMYEFSAEETFVLGIHEGYHFYGQEWINKMRTSAYAKPRGTFYPENVEYSYLTREAFTNLMGKATGEIENGDSQALGYFKLILEKQKGTLDADLDSNIAEGSANYVESLFVAAAENPELKKDFKKLSKAAFDFTYENYLKASDKSAMFDKSFEYYKISSLPYFYLGMIGKESRILDIVDVKYPYALLDEVIEKSDNLVENEKLKSVVEGYYNKVNSKSKKFLDEISLKKSSDEFVEITIPDAAFEGSGEFGEFITFKDESGNFVTLNVDVFISNSNGNLKIVHENAISESVGSEYFFKVYVKKSDVVVKDSIIRIDTDKLKVSSDSFSKTEKGYKISKNSKGESFNSNSKSSGFDENGYEVEEIEGYNFKSFQDQILKDLKVSVDKLENGVKRDEVLVLFERLKSAKIDDDKFYDDLFEIQDKLGVKVVDLE